MWYCDCLMDSMGWVGLLLLVVIKESTKLLSAEEMIKNKVSAIYCVIRSCNTACQMTDLATANATEEEKLKAMMSQSGEGFDPSKCVHFLSTI